MSRFLATLLESASRSAHGMVTGEPREPVRRTWPEVHDRARAMAAALRAGHDGRPGLTPGAAVGVLAGEPVAIAPLAQAVWLCGGSVTMLHQPTARTDLAAWAEDTVSVLKMIDAALVVLGPPVRRARPGAHRARHPVPHDRRARRRRRAVHPDAAVADEGDTALLQLTSGSTAEPKAVRITHAQPARQHLGDGAGGAARRRPRRAGVVAAALPRHGDGRLPHRADDARAGPGHGHPAGLPRPARSCGPS